MVEVIDGVVQETYYISGIDQTPSNGFDKYWDNWYDIYAMIAIVKQHLGNIINTYLIRL